MWEFNVSNEERDIGMIREMADVHEGRRYDEMFQKRNERGLFAGRRKELR